MPSGTALAVPITVAGGDYEWGIQGATRARLVFLDLGDGDLLLITIETSDPSRFDQLVGQAMPIVQSLAFE